MYSQIKDVTKEMTKYDYSCDKDLILKKKKKAMPQKICIFRTLFYAYIVHKLTCFWMEEPSQNTEVAKNIANT